MALYKHSQYIQSSSDSVFDQLQQPSTPASHSGIYRCEECGREVTSEQGNGLPPENHHQHPVSKGKIRWRLIVYADHREK